VKTEVCRRRLGMSRFVQPACLNRSNFFPAVLAERPIYVRGDSNKKGDAARPILTARVERQKTFVRFVAVLAVIVRRPVAALMGEQTTN
jgi:hypothetical protein